MPKWNTIEELQDIFIRKYTNSELGSELEKACSEEFELKRDYNGRQILELLQNVDDASIPSNNQDVEVTISYKNDILEVGNTGTTFSAETIERLCLGRASDKSSLNIGNKGTGFRSLLNDAEWIEIHSGEFAIRFSEEYSISLFNNYIDKSSDLFNELLFKQNNNWKKDYPLHFPILNCPEKIDKIKTNYDTLIRVKIKQENKQKENSITNQISQPFYKSLLFLPNINKIKIVTDSEEKTYEKLIDENNVLLAESNNTLSTYYVKQKEVSIFNKKANIIIAIPQEDNYDFSTETLYCYFPIRNVNTPVHALIHAPFLTNNSRDDIPNDAEQINVTILKECLVFLKEIAEKTTKDAYLSVDFSIKLLTPTNNFKGKIWNEDSFNLKNYYIESLNNAKILPTVNNEFISILDNPKSFGYDFPKDFKGDNFKNLLINLPTHIYSFIKELTDTCSYYKLTYENKDLADKISNLAKNLDVKKNVEIFLWWSFNYKYSGYTPLLLKNTNNEWINKGTRIYLPTDTGVSILPQSLSWVNICILNQQYVDELISQLKLNYLSQWNSIKQKYNDNSSDKRILDNFSDKYLSLQFTEQSNSSLIIEDINRQVDNAEKAYSFMYWFYQNYKEKYQNISSLNKIDFNFLNRNNQIVKSSKLYFGKEYNNSLAEKLFAATDITAFADINTLFDYDANELDSIIAFFSKCGIQTFPKIYLKEVLYPYDSFSHYVKEKYNYDYNINHLKYMCIDNFEDILNKLTTKEIIHWITTDNGLYNHIVSIEKQGGFSYRTNTSLIPLHKNEYLTYALNKTEWIEIEGKKYAPSQIVKYGKLKDKIEGIYGISENDLIKILGNNIVENFKLDFKNTLADFSDNVIKKILLALPSFDKGEISRSLYESIIKEKKGTIPSYSTSDIYLLAKDGKFYPAAQIKYTAKKVPNLKNMSSSFIHIPLKRSTETIKNWLGVENYKTNLSFESSTPLSNISEFNNEINDIKIVVLSTLELTKDNINNVKNLQIYACSEILVTDNEDKTTFKLNDYDYIKNKSKYFIKIPENLDIFKIRSAYDFRNSIIEILEDVFNSQIDSSLIECLMLNTLEDKKLIISEKYGIDMWDKCYELFYEKSATNESILTFFKSLNLEESFIKELEQINFSEDLNLHDFKLLKKALNDSNKDIIDINNYNSTININVRQNIKLLFDEYKNTKVDQFVKDCYVYALKHENEQKTFLDDINNFKIYKMDINSIENSVNYDFDKTLKQFKQYGFSLTSSLNQDINDIYNKNYQTIIKEYGVSQYILDSILDRNNNLKSELYFKIPSNISDILKSNTTYIQNENSRDYESCKEKINNNTCTIDVELLPSNLNNNKPHNFGILHERSQMFYDNQHDRKEKAGKTAENKAYNALIKEYPNLIWHSKNSNIPSNKNDCPVDVLCDMWCKNPLTYFEIKSSINDFEMSINEYNSMKNNQDNYYVVLVDIENNEISKHKYNELKNLKQVSKYKFTFIKKNKE